MKPAPKPKGETSCRGRAPSPPAGRAAGWEMTLQDPSVGSSWPSLGPCRPGRGERHSGVPGGKKVGSAVGEGKKAISSPRGGKRGPPAEGEKRAPSPRPGGGPGEAGTLRCGPGPAQRVLFRTSCPVAFFEAKEETAPEAVGTMQRRFGGMIHLSEGQKRAV